MADANTTEATAFAAEGARVGLVTCVHCGAALLIDPRDDFDWVAHHQEWHNRQARDLGRAYERPEPPAPRTTGTGRHGPGGQPGTTLGEGI